MSLILTFINVYLNIVRATQLWQRLAASLYAQASVCARPCAIACVCMCVYARARANLLIRVCVSMLALTMPTFLLPVLHTPVCNKLCIGIVYPKNFACHLPTLLQRASAATMYRISEPSRGDKTVLVLHILNATDTHKCLITNKLHKTFYPHI
jgi:hypothetical protein